MAGALEAAGLARAVGDGLIEMLALEEAACAAAVAGDKEAARTQARAALALADSAGAATVTARIQSRLRSAGVRLGATRTRRRPQTGWASLTPTETRIAELVATGMTGPEVAVAALHLATHGPDPRLACAGEAGSAHPRRVGGCGRRSLTPGQAFSGCRGGRTRAGRRQRERRRGPAKSAPTRGRGRRRVGCRRPHRRTATNSARVSASRPRGQAN